jgi:uncharacterized LabA/DUF88 family protein
MREHPIVTEPEARAISSERIGAFIDGSNLTSATGALGFSVDYRKLLDHFHASGRLVQAFYYTTIGAADCLALRKLAELHGERGYALVERPAKDEASAHEWLKCALAVELALDLIAMLPHLDHAILMSGDGEFCRLIETAQQRGVRVTVVSTVRSTPPMINEALRRQADRFIDLEDLAPVIGGQPAQTSWSECS